MKTFIKDYYNKKDLEELSKHYKYVVKATDKFLSGWGCSINKKHIQLILCKDLKELELVLNDVENDKIMGYINYYPLNKCFFNNILQLQYKYHVSLRNDWTRIYNK